jgi:hypothetical protein
MRSLRPDNMHDDLKPTSNDTSAVIADERRKAPREMAEPVLRPLSAPVPKPSQTGTLPRPTETGSLPKPATPSDSGQLKAEQVEAVAAEEVAFEDRRASPRFPFTAAAEVVDTKTRTRMNARVSDLSRDGCYVDTNAPFPIQTKIRIRMTSGTKTFETLGTIVYSLPNMGMGISFTQTAPDHAAILNKWINDLSGDTPFEFDQPEKHDAPKAAASGGDEQGFVLQELVITLMRKGTLTADEGKAMLQKLLR